MGESTMGSPPLRPMSYTASMDAVYERLGVERRSQSSQRARARAGTRHAQTWLGTRITCRATCRGARRMPTAAFCGYGCQSGAKQSTLKTYLLDAYRRRARIVVNCKVDRVLIEDGRAVGVRATVRQPEMPALHLDVRSRGRGRGRGLDRDARAAAALRLRFAGGRAMAPAASRYRGTGRVRREPLRPWEGSLQAVYSDELIKPRWGGTTASSSSRVRCTRRSWRTRFPGGNPTAVPPPDAVASQHVGARGRWFATTAGGRVTAIRRIRPCRFIDWGPTTWRTFDAAIQAAVQNHGKPGARREIFTGQSAYISYRPGQRGGIDAFHERGRPRGLRPGPRWGYFSFHQMGSCRMGNDPGKLRRRSRSPGASGQGPLRCRRQRVPPVRRASNPMITIMAMGASRVSIFIAGRLLEQVASGDAASASLDFTRCRRRSRPSGARGSFCSSSAWASS